jgi:hypothetical protein
MHLHRGHAGLETAPIRVRFRDCTWDGSDCTGGWIDVSSWTVQLRYRIKDTPITGWLSYPYSATINVNAAGFDTLIPLDGIYHLTFDMSVPDIDVRPLPMFIHIIREGSGLATSTLVPSGIYEPNDSGAACACGSFTPEPVYLDSSKRVFTGYPADPAVTPWTGNPATSNLYVEEMSPFTPLFQPLQMWWSDVFHYDLPFVRGFPPKHDEAYFPYDNLRVQNLHERFPVKDGPRGVGWMSSYVQGVVDSQGRFVFVETSGRLAFLHPDGRIETIAGWVTKENKDPVWYKKPTAVVRLNQELRGTWLDGHWPGENGGFHTPIDVALDPAGNIYYVTTYEDQVVWKVVVNDLASKNVVVSVLAGTVRAKGRNDGVGAAARFNGLASITYHKARATLIVSDQDNGMIREINPTTGKVTTLFGQNNVKFGPNVEFPYGPASILTGCTASTSATATSWDFPVCARTNSVATTTGSPAPDFFVPHTVRIDSQGRLVVLDLGFGVIRQVDLTSNATKILARINQKFERWNRGWAWFDIDTTGNAGGLDGIYWCKFVGEVWGSQHGPYHGDPGCGDPSKGSEPLWKGITCGMPQCSNRGQDQCKTCLTTVSNMFSENYGWIPPNNNDQMSYLVYTQSSATPQFGRPQNIDPPHYPWLVAVDPRGAVLFAGSGESGLTRLRAQRNDDPIPASYNGYDCWENFWNGEDVYAAGTPEGMYAGGTDAPTVSPLSIFNWNGHNLLGYGDTWGARGFTDQQLLDTFKIPPSILNNATARSLAVFYLRACIGSNSSTPLATVDWTSRSPGKFVDPITVQSVSSANSATSNPATSGSPATSNQPATSHSTSASPATSNQPATSSPPATSGPAPVYCSSYFCSSGVSVSNPSSVLCASGVCDQATCCVSTCSSSGYQCTGSGWMLMSANLLQTTSCPSGCSDALCCNSPSSPVCGSWSCSSPYTSDPGLATQTCSGTCSDIQCCLAPSCSSFSCAYGTADATKTCGSGICDPATCCIPSMCSSHTCSSTLTARPNSATLSCGAAACSDATCCAAATSAAPTSAPAASSQTSSTATSEQHLDSAALLPLAWLALLN